MKQLLIILLAVIATMGSSSAQSFVGKLNPNPVVNKNDFSLGDSLRILAVLVDFPEDKEQSLERFCEQIFFARRRNFGKAWLTKL